MLFLCILWASDGCKLGRVEKLKKSIFDFLQVDSVDTHKNEDICIFRLTNGWKTELENPKTGFFFFLIDFSDGKNNKT